MRFSEPPAGRLVRLTPSAGVPTLTANTRSSPTWRRDAHRPSATDLELPRRVRRPARLPADRARDRGAGRARLAFDRTRPPGEPRARGAPAPRPDEAARPRAARP